MDTLGTWDEGLVPGDMAVFWEGELPSSTNQYIRRVASVADNGGGSVRMSLGPVVPREEWPRALKEATAPSRTYVNVTLPTRESPDVSRTVHVCTANGLEIARLDCRSGALAARTLAAVIAAASALGNADSLEAESRQFAITKGDGGPFNDRTYWQITDGKGTAIDIEPKSLLQRHPPDIAKAALTAARFAYVDGLNEGRALAAARPDDAEEAFPVPTGP